MQRVVRIEVDGIAQTPPPVWMDGKARLAVSPTPTLLKELPEVDAKYTALTYMRGGASLAVIPDAESKSVSLVDGFNGYYRSGSGIVTRNVDSTFYVPRRDGFLGVILYNGTVRFAPAYFVAPHSKGGLNAAIATLESTLDRRTLERRSSAGQPTIDLWSALGEARFGAPAPTLKFDPKVDGIRVQGDILQFALTNAVTRKTAVLRFDLERYRLIHALVDGREMPISHTDE